MSRFSVNNERIAKNTSLLYIRMIVIMAINFYMARVVLDVLGVVDYGIYNVVGTIVVVFSFLKSSLSEATQRFLNFEMGKDNDEKQLKQVFSTCMNCYMMLSILVFVLGELFWLYGKEYILNIPQERIDAATFTFHLALLSFVVGVLQVPYHATIIAYERMGFFAKISIIEALLKLLLTVFVSYIAVDKLELYSVLMFINTLVILLIYYLYCKYKFVICCYTIIWKKVLFIRILSFTGWNMLGSLTSVLSESGVGLAFNSFCGVVVNASIGLANQINNALSGFSSGYMTAFKPQLIKSFAAEQYDDFSNLLCRSSKFSFFLFYLISIPLILNMEFLLSIWLVEVPKYASAFAKIILIGSLIDATSNVFYTAMGATGRIRNYQVAISIVFFAHFLLTIFLLYIKVPYIWVFFSRLLTRGAINFGIGLYFVQGYTNVSAKKYVMDTLFPIVKGGGLPMIIYFCLIHFGDSNSLFFVGINMLCFEVIAITSIFLFGLSDSEKYKINSFIRSRL